MQGYKTFISQLHIICNVEYSIIDYTVQLKCNVACAREQLEGNMRVPSD